MADWRARPAHLAEGDQVPIIGEIDIDTERDEGIARRCLAGDADAFAELYRLYREPILRACARRLGNRHEAEEAMQETFVRAWRAVARFDGSWRLYPWLRTIANNVCIDMLRRRTRVVLTELHDEHAGTVDPVESHLGALDARRDLAQLRAVLGSLPERNRTTLLLHEVDGLSSRQIAEEQGASVRAVETVLFRTRQMLRTAMERPAMVVVALALRMLAVVRRVSLRAVHVGHRMAQSDRALPIGALVSGGVALGVLGLVLPGGHLAPRSPVHVPLRPPAVAVAAPPADGAGNTGAAASGTPPTRTPEGTTPPDAPRHSGLGLGPAAPNKQRAEAQPFHLSVLGLTVGADSANATTQAAQTVTGYVGQLLTRSTTSHAGG
jgi:RNA polymerase sigma-70 factor (ECF subfamily)